MGNVSYRLGLTFFQTLMDSPILAGAGKSVFWYANVTLFLFHVGYLYCWAVLRL